ncbi:MAG: hypothetical protein Q8L14_38015 [Myxococcales bacterium]|nr:hypothetical protein [Myxococcales bacterium]
MPTTTMATDSKRSWDGIDRRSGVVPQPPLFGELLVESSWRPADVVPAASEGWLRAYGYAKNRRDR